MATRQRATAMYLIDRLALRAGNEKGEDEADTVGCCSLRFEHITLEPPNKVIFDFLGKDSIRYYNEVQVDEQVFKNIKLFKKDPKKDGDDLFDRLTVCFGSRLSQIMTPSHCPVLCSLLDRFFEQASPNIHARPVSESLPYLQCQLDVPRGAN